VVQASLPASAPRPRLVLLEYDTRFAVFPEFVPYDFAKPVRLPGMFHPLSFSSPFSPSSRRNALLTSVRAAGAGGPSLPFKAELKGTATRIICDPPFLSDDCQTKGKEEGGPCPTFASLPPFFLFLVALFLP